jgi:hypothetical protein
MTTITKNRNFFKWPKLLYFKPECAQFKFELYKYNDEFFNIYYRNGLDLGENYRNINGCKTFAAPIAQTLVDKQVKFHPTNWDLANCFRISWLVVRFPFFRFFD